MQTLGRALAALLFTLTFAGAALAGDALEIKGSWAVNLDKTLESMHASPEMKKMSEEQRQRMDTMMKGLAKSMKIVIDDKTITFMAGPRKQVMTYTVTSSAADKVVVSATLTKGEQSRTDTLTFTMKGKCLHFESEKSDDMKHYYWDPAPKKDAKKDAKKDDDDKDDDDDDDKGDDDDGMGDDDDGMGDD